MTQEEAQKVLDCISSFVYNKALNDESWTFDERLKHLEAVRILKHYGAELRYK